MDDYPIFEASVATQSVQRKRPRKRVLGVKQLRKRTVKYLSVCRDPKAYSAVVKSAPDSVIRSICDAALNVQRNRHVSLTNPQKHLFRRHASSINLLASKKLPLLRKRRVVAQRGGAFWIPALIGAALGGLGSTLFGSKQ